MSEEEKPAEQPLPEPAPRADRVNRFEHCDYAATQLAAPHVDGNGFVLAATRMARTGVQVYQDANGNIRREYRSPEEVQKSMDSFKNLPVTSSHPPEMVTPENVKQYAIGAVGEELKFDGKWIIGKIKIWSRQGQMDAKARPAVSCGYSCELDMTPGVSPDGEHYDGSQRNIRGNHFAAAVTEGRAGPLAIARLDANDAVAIVEGVKAEPLTSNQIKEPDTMGHVLRIDNLEFTVSDPNAQVAFNRALENARKQSEDEIALQRNRADSAHKLLADVQKNLTTVTAERDTLEAQLRAQGMDKIKFDEDEITVADLRDEAKRKAFINGLVFKKTAARASLVNEAAKYVGIKLDTLADSAIKKLVIGKLDPGARLDGQNDDYIDATYETLLRLAGNRKGQRAPIDRVREVVATPTGDTPRVDFGNDNPDDARERMVARQRAAFVK
jgi:hypothetical protein